MSVEQLVSLGFSEQQRLFPCCGRGESGDPLLRHRAEHAWPLGVGHLGRRRRLIPAPEPIRGDPPDDDLDLGHMLAEERLGAAESPLSHLIGDILSCDPG
jgi:hypothetical protein